MTLLKHLGYAIVGVAAVAIEQFLLMVFIAVATAVEYQDRGR